MKFVGVDGEGVTGEDGRHRYVMLGVGQDRIENPGGLGWEECFQFLYSRYRAGTAFVGFFLLYDFTQMFKTMREERVWRLLTSEGRMSRKHKMPHRMPHPVDCGGWQFDMLGTKRLRIRPKICACVEASCKCKGKAPWMYVCDVGPFFQTSLINVLDPKNWETPIVSDEEYGIILEGKKNRKTAKLDEKMREYNALENEVLERVMRTVDKGFLQMGVHLPPGKWFGPGQVAQAWMKGRAPERKTVIERCPEWALEAARKAYFGGWFETFVHGWIPGITYEYDLNSAYPWIISNLPCLEHGEWSKGDSNTVVCGDSDLVLVYATVDGGTGRHSNIGAMLHRDSRGRISRPVHTAGWYWHDELQAAVEAGCVNAYRIDQWVKYSPCDCPPPMREVQGLYEQRLKVGKNTPLGVGAKLGYNSMYGKFAQSIGEPIFGNSIYASRITSGCRKAILSAIASHPHGKSAVAMVATDGVYFIEPHPGLPLSDRLGEWSVNEKKNLTIFKPGVYWDDKTRDAIEFGENPKFKARGINAKDFAEHLGEIDAEFRGWGDRFGGPPAVQGLKGDDQWPHVEYKTAFAMTTCLQALRRGKWETAGHVEEGKTLVQSSNPKDKRAFVWEDSGERTLYRSEPHQYGNGSRKGDVESKAYSKRFGMDDPWSDENKEDFGITEDGYAGDEYREMLMQDTEGIDYESTFEW